MLFQKMILKTHIIIPLPPNQLKKILQIHQFLRIPQRHTQKNQVPSFQPTVKVVLNCPTTTLPQIVVVQRIPRSSQKVMMPKLKRWFKEIIALIRGKNQIWIVKPHSKIRLQSWQMARAPFQKRIRFLHLKLIMMPNHIHPLWYLRQQMVHIIRMSNWMKLPIIDCSQMTRLLT